MSQVEGKTYECDVLVIGGGLAGCYAALRASDIVDRVILLDKARISRSGASLQSGGNIFCLLTEDDKDSWLKEMVEFGDYMNNQEWTQILLEEIPLRFRELEAWGVKFEKDKNGDYVRTAGRGTKNIRLVMYGGVQLMDTLRQQLEKRNITLLDRVMSIDLLTVDGQHPTKAGVIGAIGLNTWTRQPHIFKANAIVLASGGPMFQNMTGDGVAQAFRAGAELTGMEFTNSFCWSFEQKFTDVHLNTLIAMGWKLVNNKGERFMEKYSPLKEGAPVKDLAMAMIKEHREGRDPIYADMRHFDVERLRSIPTTGPKIMRALEKAGIDITKRMVTFDLWGGLSHTNHGGVNIDIRGESSLPGLYAAGVDGGYPSHGMADAGGGNIAMCCVGGYRAGEFAAKYAMESKKKTFDTNQPQVRSLVETALHPLSVEKGLLAGTLLEIITEAVSKAGIVRSKERIKGIQTQLEDWKALIPQLMARDTHELIRANEIRNHLQCVELVHVAALERNESRGYHLREDFPYKDNLNWLKRINLSRSENGIAMRFEPIPFYRYPIKPQKYEKLPLPIPRSED